MGLERNDTSIRHETLISYGSAECGPIVGATDEKPDRIEAAQTPKATAQAIGIGAQFRNRLACRACADLYFDNDIACLSMLVALESNSVFNLGTTEAST